MTKLLIIFVALNILNVVVQTVRSLFTIHGNKYTASLANAIAYGLYTVVIIYTVCDLPLWEKVLIVAITNLVGVFFVKLIEEKTQKDKLWKVEAVINKQEYYTNLLKECEEKECRYNYFDVIGDKERIQVNFYCYTQEESKTVKEILDNYNCKYFVSESKSLVG